MGTPKRFRKTSIKRRLRWNQAMRSPLPPTLVGLVTFSFVSVALGAGVYLAAVSSLIQQSPGVQTVVTAVEESGVPEAVTSVLSGEAFSSSGIDASAGTFDSVDLSSPEFDSAEHSAGDSSSNSDSSGGIMPPSSGEGGGGNSGEEPEEPEEPTAPTEAEEAQYHALIVQEYNNLSEYEQAVQGVIQEFNEQCLNLSSDTRYVCFQNCAGTADDLMRVSDLRIPEESRWYSAAEGVNQLYEDLTATVYLYQRAWLLNLPLDDPRPYQKEWSQPITEHIVNGEIDFLTSYTQLKPQVGAAL